MIVLGFLRARQHQPHPSTIEKRQPGRSFEQQRQAQHLLIKSGSALHILRDDAYLAIRTDGVALVSPASPAGEVLLAWSDLARARWDDRRVELVLERKEGEPVVVARPFARIGGPELAGKIEQARRRESLGMLGR